MEHKTDVARTDATNVLVLSSKILGCHHLLLIVIDGHRIETHNSHRYTARVVVLKVLPSTKVHPGIQSRT